MRNLRLFFALPVLPRIGEIILHHQTQFKSVSSDVKWVAPENLHVTLKFLGDTPEGRLAMLKEAAERTAASLEPFELAWSGFGAFPGLKRPRVIWAGLHKGADEMLHMAEVLENELYGIGIARETKKFTPHVTIGRVRTLAGIEKLSRLLEQAENCRIGSMSVRSFGLIKSTLLPAGPVYEEIFNFPLGEEHHGQTEIT